MKTVNDRVNVSKSDKEPLGDGIESSARDIRV